MKAGSARPEGLLHFENNIIFSFFPLHVGMRWYWKDFDSERDLPGNIAFRYPSNLPFADHVYCFDSLNRSLRRPE